MPRKDRLRERDGSIRGREARQNSAEWSFWEDDAFTMHMGGIEPSLIDSMLKLPSGMARELIVAHWSRDRRGE